MVPIAPSLGISSTKAVTRKLLVRLTQLETRPSPSAHSLHGQSVARLWRTARPASPWRFCWEVEAAYPAGRMWEDEWPKDRVSLAEMSPTGGGSGCSSADPR